MKKYIAFAFVAGLALSACTMNAMTPEEISSVQADCSNVDQQIAMLQKEKAENDNRTAAGVGDFLPVTAMARFMTGRYDSNANISTGVWARLITKKLAELNTVKANCQM